VFPLVSELRAWLQVPWKLLKKPSTLGTNKRVYICPERSCLHHDPTHALGDLVGIKKHYRRKHCTEKQWKCVKCSKRYAVQSDFKAHLKTCGTRGHCCDCGRVFSRYESDSVERCRYIVPSFCATCNESALLNIRQHVSHFLTFRYYQSLRSPLLFTRFLQVGKMVILVII